MSRRSSAVAGGKRMRKRKELDALTGSGGGPVVGVGRNRRLMCSSDSDSCSSSRAPTPIKLRRQITRRRKRSLIANTWCSALRVFLAFGCIVWVVFETYTFLDIREIQLHLQTQLDEGGEARARYSTSASGKYIISGGGGKLRVLRKKITRYNHIKLRIVALKCSLLPLSKFDRGYSMYIKRYFFVNYLPNTPLISLFCPISVLWGRY